ncbi:hypothetical protein PGT21_033745 [Puccinia graminis f. sp. tritici]|uniref:Uncharacterized protein n=1 Tax=Puccinia graminis f. sp. tritici TaxID=56615 RepID=A0A5B0LY77_PUCGR|nr:hypothetical protein PGT21_033745 [Puccinia graminis f. sp. tritici]
MSHHSARNNSYCPSDPPNQYRTREGHLNSNPARNQPFTGTGDTPNAQGLPPQTAGHGFTSQYSVSSTPSANQWAAINSDYTPSLGGGGNMLDYDMPPGTNCGDNNPDQTLYSPSGHHIRYSCEYDLNLMCYRQLILYPPAMPQDRTQAGGGFDRTGNQSGGGFDRTSQVNPASSGASIQPMYLLVLNHYPANIKDRPAC